MDEVKDEAKERVEKELVDLNEKIVKLTAFVYGKDFPKAGLSDAMMARLRSQLHVMEEYAQILQGRLVIWGLTDAEIQAKFNHSIM